MRRRRKRPHAWKCGALCRQAGSWRTSRKKQQKSSRKAAERKCETCGTFPRAHFNARPM
jgi:hypothetical protein